MTKVFLWTPGLVFDSRHVEMCRVQSLVKRRLQPLLPGVELVSGLLVDWSIDDKHPDIDALAPEFDVYARSTPAEFGTVWGIRKPTNWAIHLAETIGATHLLRIIQDAFIDDPQAFAAQMLDALPTPGHWVAAYPHPWLRTWHRTYCNELGIRCEEVHAYPNGAVMFAPLASWQKYYRGLPVSVAHHMDDVMMGEWMRQRGEMRIDWEEVWTHHHHAWIDVSQAAYQKHLAELAGAA